MPLSYGDTYAVIENTLGHFRYSDGIFAFMIVTVQGLVQCVSWKKLYQSYGKALAVIP